MSAADGLKVDILGAGFMGLYCVRYYETIAGGFYPQGVADYPRGRELVTIVANYLASVAVLVFHYHSTLIECPCFACAGVFVSFVNIPDAATLISVNICLRSLCVVVNCFHIALLLLSYTLFVTGCFRYPTTWINPPCTKYSIPPQL